MPGRLVFETTAGTGSGSSLLTVGACEFRSDAPARAIVKALLPDGTIDLGLDLDLGFTGADAPARAFFKLDGSTLSATTNTIVCPGTNMSSVFDSSWHWLRVGDPAAYKVSADGRTIEGRSVEAGPPGGGITIVTNWKFTALRE
jgi:hypothetical protein